MAEKAQMDNGEVLTSEETLWEKQSPYWSTLVCTSLEIPDAVRVYSKAFLKANNILALVFWSGMV